MRDARGDAVNKRTRSDAAAADDDDDDDEKEEEDAMRNDMMSDMPC
jgi:hypothetical protein